MPKDSYREQVEEENCGGSDNPASPAQRHLVNGRLTDVVDVISCILALLGTVDFCLTGLFLPSCAV